MFSRLGTLELSCDAPPYAVVRACETLGFQSPLDVRWCRKSQVIHGHSGPRGISALLPWNWFSQGHTCTCGNPLPVLHKHAFTFDDSVADYLLGQCCRCRTIVWELLVPIP